MEKKLRELICPNGHTYQLNTPIDCVIIKDGESVTMESEYPKIRVKSDSIHNAYREYAIKFDKSYFRLGFMAAFRIEMIPEDSDLYKDLNAIIQSVIRPL